MTGKELESTLNIKGISQRDLASKVGMTESAISNWIKRGVPDKKEQLVANIIGASLKPEKEDCDEFDLDENRLSINVLKDVRASAGSGFNILDNTNESFELIIDKRIIGLKSDKDIVGIRVDGKSMSPTVNNNDLVIINTTTTSFKGDNLYVLNYADNLLVKRLQYDPSSNTLDIISDNPNYKNYTINLSENQQYLKIVGIVVTIITNK